MELKSFFLIKKCATAAKHLMGCLKAMPESFGWNGRGSIKLQQFSSVISSGVSLSLSNLSSVAADKCRGIFNLQGARFLFSSSSYANGSVLYNLSFNGGFSPCFFVV